MIVYLSGSITPDPKHNTWRAAFHEQFSIIHGYTVLDPMRFKDVADLDAKGYTSKVPGSLFVERDYCDIQKSDVVVIVFRRGLTRQSIGTWAEFGWCIVWRKPVIIMTDDPSVWEHPFVKKWAALVTNDPKQVIDAVRFLDKSPR